MTISFLVSVCDGLLQFIDTTNERKFLGHFPERFFAFPYNCAGLNTKLKKDRREKYDPGNRNPGLIQARFRLVWWEWLPYEIENSIVLVDCRDVDCALQFQICRCRRAD